MAQPKVRLFGSLSLSGIGEAVKGVPSKVTNDERFGKQLKVTAAIWDDDGVSIEVWDPEAKKSYKVGNLRASTFTEGPAGASTAPTAPAAAEGESDLPF